MTDAERIREAAEEVLGRPEYDELTPSLGAELLSRLRNLVADALDAILGSAAAGGLGRVIAFGLVALVVVGAVVLLLGLRRRASIDPVIEVDLERDAGAMLAKADEAAAAGDHELAVRSRYGALVLVLVEAGVLAARPGLTVGEVDGAVDVGAPTAARSVRAAGHVLADVVYGGRTATATDDQEVDRGLAAVAVAVGRRDLTPTSAGTRP